MFAPAVNLNEHPTTPKSSHLAVLKLSCTEHPIMHKYVRNPRSNNSNESIWIKRNQQESTLITINQTESTWIKMNHESQWINVNQTESKMNQMNHDELTASKWTNMNNNESTLIPNGQHELTWIQITQNLFQSIQIY